MGRPVDDRKMWNAFEAKMLKAREDALFEAYENGAVTKDQLIEEGIWDRIKARGAGVKGSVKGLGRQIKGAAQSGASKLAGASGVASDKQVRDMQQTAKDTKQSGKSLSLDSKSLSLINSNLNKIQKVISSFSTDMQKLGINPKTIAKTNPEAGKALEKIISLQTEIKTLVGNLTSTGNRGRAISNLKQNVNPNQ